MEHFQGFKVMMLMKFLPHAKHCGTCSVKRSSNYHLHHLFYIIFDTPFLLLEYNCFTMLHSFLLYNKMDQLNVYICPLPHEPLSVPSYPSTSLILLIKQNMFLRIIEGEWQMDCPEVTGVHTHTVISSGQRGMACFLPPSREPSLGSPGLCWRCSGARCLK